MRKTRRVLQFGLRLEYAINTLALQNAAKFYFKFTRRYGANFIKFYSLRHKFRFKILRRSDIARCVHIAKHTAKRCFRKIRLHEIPHAKSLSRTLRPRYVSFWRATRLLVRQISRHAAQVRTPLQSRHLRSRTFRSGFWCAAKLSALTRLEPKLPQHKLGLRGKPNFSGKAKPPLAASLT